jgi:hypothetical protein
LRGKVTAAVGNTPQNAASKNDAFHFASPIALTSPFPFRLSGFFFHPRRLVRGTAESTLGKNLTYFHHSSASRMYLAVIIAGGHAFFACFACHLGFTSFSAQFANLILSVVFFG